MSNLRDYFNEAQDDANDNFFNYDGDEDFDFVDDEDNLMDSMAMMTMPLIWRQVVE